MKKNAFTLIELLVVIAIIAILAAILFPVFAQAKMAAKKTQSLSNLKNIGTAVQIYIADYDDMYPLSSVQVTSIGPTSTTSNRFVPTPAKIAVDLGVEPIRVNAANAFVSNSIQPYIKNIDIFSDPVAIRHDGGTFSMLGGLTPPSTAKDITYTYNGLLHAYSSTSVNSVSNTVLYWPGMGKRSLIAGGYASPWLNCTQTNPVCVYVPTKSTCSFSVNGESSSYTSNSSGRGFEMFSGVMTYTYADSHAKARRIGVNQTGDQDPRTDPFARYNGIFVANRSWDQFFCHPYLFRPDIDHQTWEPRIIF
ncbi:MAG: prepilin-type N-terminal cleavage/methylation domain-containing protein [Armatimonadetes bacterium]|nr:prepilin-type N-terminal cleavage/methylation domain-containing protein [Armatimonadota bacterium]